MNPFLVGFGITLKSRGGRVKPSKTEKLEQIDEFFVPFIAQHILLPAGTLAQQITLERNRIRHDLRDQIRLGKRPKKWNGDLHLLQQFFGDMARFAFLGRPNLRAQDQSAMQAVSHSVANR